MPSPRPRLTMVTCMVLGLLALGTIVAAWAQAGLRVDPSNATMLAPDTADARATAALHAAFGGARTTLQCFLTIPDQELLPGEEQAIDDLAERLRADARVAAVQPRVAAADGVTLLAVELATDEAEAAEAVTTICRNACPATLRHLATGMPLIGAAIARAVHTERTTIVPRIAAVLFVLLWCCYRSIGRALAVLLPAGIAIAWTGGLFAGSGHQLDPIAVLLEPVLLTVGVAASVHYVEAFAAARQRGHGPYAATRRASRALATPALWATLTTMLGFWSLAGNAIPAVVDFGIYAALGAAIANALTFALLPTWLRWWPGADGPPLQRANSHPFLLRLVLRHRLAIVLLTMLGSLLAAVAWLRLSVDNDPLHVLPQDHPFRLQHDELAARLGGAEICTLLVAPDSPAQDPGRMLPFTAAVVGTPPAAGLAGPPRRSRDGSVAVPVLLAPSGSHARLPWFDMVQGRADALGWTGVTVAGASVQMARDSWRLVQTQIAGMAGTLLALLVCIAIGARSWRLGVLGLLPVGLPWLLLYGGLSALGQPMTVASAMIGSVMLGLIVDSTIHLLHHYRDERRTGTRAEATTTALTRVLRPIALSSAVLALGFLTGLGGSMTTTVDFSVLAAVTIGLAFVATAIVLPAVLLLRDPAPPHAAAEANR